MIIIMIMIIIIIIIIIIIFIEESPLARLFLGQTGQCVGEERDDADHDTEKKDGVCSYVSGTLALAMISWGWHTSRMWSQSHLCFVPSKLNSI
jgi:ABC-type phosphate transport system permease subunit